MDEDDAFEHLLQEGLKPRQAPSGFSVRLMARLPEASPVSSVHQKRVFWLPAMRWATATVLLGIAGASYWQHQQNERLAGEQARNQLILALRISAATLNDVQHKVARNAKGESE